MASNPNPSDPELEALMNFVNDDAMQRVAFIRQSAIMNAAAGLDPHEAWNKAKKLWLVKPDDC